MSHTHATVRNAERPSIIDPVPVRTDINYWPTKNVLFLRAEGKDTRYLLFPWWNSVGVPQVAVRGDGRGDVWVLEFVWVSKKLTLDQISSTNLFVSSSDFFPVVITFLRQIPFIGTFLSLPYIRGVRCLIDLRSSCSINNDI